MPDVTATPLIPLRPPVRDTTARPDNQPTLNVSPSPPIEIGKPVLFEVVLWQPPPPGWDLQYRFDFGDGTVTDWTPERQSTHIYSSPGNGSYPVHVEIASTYRDRVLPAKAIDKNLDVIQPSNPTPSATELPSITVSATPVTPSPTSPTPASPTATASPTETPFISATTPPPASSSSKVPWLYFAGGFFAAIALVTLVYRQWKPKVPIAAPLMFYPHADWDAPQTPPQNVAINYELHFNSNLSAGEDWLATDGATVILRKNKQ